MNYDQNKTIDGTLIEKVTAVLSGGKKILQSETTKVTGRVNDISGPAIQKIQSRSEPLRFTMKTTEKRKAPDVFLDNTDENTL